MEFILLSFNSTHTFINSTSNTFKSIIPKPHPSLSKDFCRY